MRTYDPQKIRAAVAQYADQIVGFCPEDWLGNPKNIAFINDNEDIALFETQNDLFNTVCGHYFFFSRGKEAIKAAKEFLQELFETTYVETITGITPIDNLGALWMNRRLGFKEHGDVETEVGPCRFVIMTKEDWKRTNQQ